VDVSSGEVRGVRVLHYEIASLPPKTLAPRVLMAINSLRYKMREALTPAWDWEANDWKQQTKGRRDAGDLLDPADLSGAVLLDVLPVDGVAGRPKRIKWRSAADPYAYEDWDEENYLMPLQPFAEHEETPVERSSAGGGEREWAAVVAHLVEHGECLVGALPPRIRKSKKQLEKRPDLFSVRVVREGCLVSLVGDAGPGPGQAGRRGAAAEKAGSKREQQLVDAISRLLHSKRTVGLGELGSTGTVKALLATQKPKLQKIRPFLSAHQDVFEQSTDSKGQVVVTLHNGSGGGQAGGRSGKGGGAASGASSGKGRRGGGGSTSSSAVQDHIAELCSSSPALASDFDGRVCQFLRDIQEKQGLARLDDSFEMLHDVLGKKGHRTDVQKWPGYIMRLLMNWSSAS